MNIKNIFKKEFKRIVVYLLVLIIIVSLFEYFWNAKMPLNSDTYYSFIYILGSFLIFSHIMLSVFIDSKSASSDLIASMKKIYKKIVIYNIVGIFFIIFFLLIPNIKNIEFEDMNGIYAFVLVLNNLVDFAKMLIIVTKIKLKDSRK